MCTAQVKGEPIVYLLLNHANFSVTDQVVTEVVLRMGKSDVQIARPLISAGRISTVATATIPVISDFYAISETDCGVIRTGLLLTDTLTVIDDKEAYVIACRYELRPIFLLDLLVLLVRQHGLDKALAVEMVQSMTKRYSVGYVAHTVSMLR